MSHQPHPSQNPSTKKSTLTPAEAAEKAARAGAGLHFYSPTAPPAPPIGPWPSSIAQTLQHEQTTSGQKVPASPLPAPLAKKGRSTPLDLDPWEGYQHNVHSSGSSVGKRRRSTPETETANEAADDGTSNRHRSIKPASMMIAPQSEKPAMRKDSNKGTEGGSKKTSGPSNE